MDDVNCFGTVMEYAASKVAASKQGSKTRPKLLLVGRKRVRIFFTEAHWMLGIHVWVVERSFLQMYHHIINLYLYCCWCTILVWIFLFID